MGQSTLKLTSNERYTLIDCCGIEVTQDEVARKIDRLMRHGEIIFQNEKEELKLFQKITEYFKTTKTQSIKLFQGVDTDGNGTVDIQLKDKGGQRFSHGSLDYIAMDHETGVAPFEAFVPDFIYKGKPKFAGEVIFDGAKYYVVDLPSQSNHSYGVPNLLLDHDTMEIIWSIDSGAAGSAADAIGMPSSVDVLLRMGYELESNADTSTITKNGTILTTEEMFELSRQTQIERLLVYLGDGYDAGKEILERHNIKFIYPIPGAGHIGENNIDLFLQDQSNRSYFVPVAQNPSDIGISDNPTPQQIYDAILAFDQNQLSYER